MTTTATLTERERAILDFAKLRWNGDGPKEAAIRVEFDLSATSYYQQLNALLDRPEALEVEPVLVNRLRRVREQRRATRSGRVRPA